MVKAKNNVIKSKKKTTKKVKKGVLENKIDVVVEEKAEKPLETSSKESWLKKLWNRLKSLFC